MPIFCREFGNFGTTSQRTMPYVSLAELIGAPLITRDSRLAAAPGHLARVELF
jgi:hypothetical protein